MIDDEDMCKFALSSENKTLSSPKQKTRFHLLPKVHKPGAPGRPVVLHVWLYY